MSDGTRTWTVVALLKTTSDYFREKGAASPRVDAELLLAHLLGGRRIDLYLQHDRPVNGDELARFREMVRRRASGKPVQRITGGAEFYSIPFRVHDGVFIPRPETELLVDRGIEFLRDEGGEAPFAVDAGTGSGVIAVSLAKRIPRLRVEATDRSPEAVLCARENARLAGVEERVDVIETDLAAHLERLGAAADLVLSNPPYVTTAEMAELPREVGEHDPSGALHGGEDGLLAIRPLIAAAAVALRPGGLLVFEASDATAAGAVAAVEETGLYESARVGRDLAGRLRVVEARRIGAAPPVRQEEDR
ncbi:MAG: peptide chain release factor N(5)-glutamine methyltransferase [Candidatus Eisenbacteria bacterium]|nr:peptide chain release factor N(5)-glutamine methyltransferase [Candidatus Eisenbacteria bacterium]